MCVDLIRQTTPGVRFLNWAAAPGFCYPGSPGSLALYPVRRRLPRADRAFLPDLEIEASDGLAYLRRFNSRFAGIFCTDVFKHIRGDELRLEWLETAREALRPGGFSTAGCPMPEHDCRACSLHRPDEIRASP